MTGVQTCALPICQPYILEATIDKIGILYHFCARKVKSNKDFVTHAITPPTEEDLTEIPEEETALFSERVCSAEVTYNGAGDAEISFEGHNYKLLKKLD